MIEFVFHKEGDTFVIWVECINRYLQLKEPAFYVFQEWAAGADIQDIAVSCIARYSLSGKESKRFVDEITGEFQALIQCGKVKPVPQSDLFDSNANTGYFSAHYYRVGNHNFKFTYRNKFLKELFHPLFLPQETTTIPTIYTSFDLATDEVSDTFSVNGGEVRFFTFDEIDGYQGAIFMEMLNAIHNMDDSSWMGVFHASAVTDGKSAVIFTAPSGSGKTSLALLMIAGGFNLISDDFVPVALSEPEVYSFPTTISVKEGTLPLLRRYFPEIVSGSSIVGDATEMYFAPAGEPGFLESVRAKAIVFVSYQPGAEFELKRELNLAVMNNLLKQSWVAGNSSSAQRFMKWYFSLPVYSLCYSDNEKAVEAIKQLF